MNSNSLRAIRCGRLVDGLSRQSFCDQLILLNQDRIQAIQPWEQAPVNDPLDTLDLSHLTVLPGLIDTHLHLTFDPANPNGYYNPQQDAREILLRAAGNAQAALRAGVTTLADCGADNEIIFPLRDAIQRGDLVGPRILASGAPIVPRGGHGSEIGKFARGVSQVRSAVREQAEAGADFIKVMATAGGGEDPAESHYSLSELIAIQQAAADHGLVVAAHAHGTAGIRHCVQAGIQRIEHCTFFNGAAGFDFDAQVAQAIVDHGVIVSPTNGIDYRRLQAGGKGAPRLELNQIWRKLLSLGVQFAASSDAGVTDMFYDDYALLPELMVTELGLSPSEAIVACTRTASKALGLSGQVGTLEAGKIADLVAVEGNPLEDITALRQIKLVLCAGKIVHGNP